MDIEQKINRYIRKITAILLAGIFVLILLHVFLPFYLFNLDKENNLPCWFSTQLLFFVSVTALINYILSKEFKAFNKPWIWLVISLAFSFLSLDEFASIHERITNKLWAAHSFLESLHDLWLLVYVPTLIIGLILGKDFIKYLYFQQKKSFKLLVAGLAFWIAAVLLELIGQYYLEKHNFCLYQYEIIAEEAFEMLGSLSFLAACLNVTKSLLKNQEIRNAPK